MIVSYNINTEHSVNYPVGQVFHLAIIVFSPPLVNHWAWYKPYGLLSMLLEFSYLSSGLLLVGRCLRSSSSGAHLEKHHQIVNRSTLLLRGEVKYSCFFFVPFFLSIQYAYMYLNIYVYRWMYVGAYMYV